ncbi:MAG TPA: flagellar export chaperone FliS [Desulfobulbaceae bacterium]|nr:flagellar export chaperone FliS [Desulfobulbaceae bacterium]
MNAYMNQYQTNQILTASPEQILIMLYDGAIRFCRQAIAASDNGNITMKLERISKTFAIITEFSNSLNHEIGGDIAGDLDGLYHFMLRELNHARKDTTGEHLRNVEKLLVDLRLTWGEAVEINKREQGMTALQQPDAEQSVQMPVKRLSAAG